jgi:hypothetical protein
VYFATTGGIHDLDASGIAPNLTPDVERLVMDTNGRATLVANGWLYFNVGYTLKRLRVVGQEYALAQDCGWEAQIPSQCPMAGYVTALVKYGRWIWAFVYDGTNTWGIKGREAGPNDRYGPIVWYVAPIYLPNLKVTAAHVSGLVSQNPRLWMAVYDGTNRALRWAPLALDSAYRDLRQARLYRFAASAQFDEQEQDHGDDALPKYVREFVGETENMSGSTQDSLSIAKDGEATFATIGSMRSNPRPVVRPTGASEILASRYILRHNLSGTTTAPPILRKLSTRVLPRPDVLEVRPYQVICGPGVRGADGALDGRSVKQARSTLAQLQTGLPRTMEDEDRTSLNVLIAAGMSLSEVQADLGDHQERRVLVADLTVAVLSSVAVGLGFVWDDGTVYDTGKVWG